MLGGLPEWIDNAGAAVAPENRHIDHPIVANVNIDDEDINHAEGEVGEDQNEADPADQQPEVQPADNEAAQGDKSNKL